MVLEGLAYVVLGIKLGPAALVSVLSLWPGHSQLCKMQPGEITARTIQKVLRQN